MLAHLFKLRGLGSVADVYVRVVVLPLLCSMVVCALLSYVLRACVCVCMRVACSLLFDMVIPRNSAEVKPSPFRPCSPHLYISKSFVAKCKGAKRGLVCS